MSTSTLGRPNYVRILIILNLLAWLIIQCKEIVFSVPKLGFQSVKSDEAFTPSYDGDTNQNGVAKQVPRNVSRDHPHAGARDANGSWGYIADVGELKRWMRNKLQQAQVSNRDKNHSVLTPSTYLPLKNQKHFDKICNVDLGKGAELRGWKMLAKTIQIHGPDPGIFSEAIDNTTAKPDFEKTNSDKKHARKGKILCVVYTHAPNHYLVRAVAETWGWRCDVFFAASTKTTEFEPWHSAVDLPHLGKEDYYNMWQKTRSILAYLHDYYLDQFDYFYICGDDTYVIVENLLDFLDSAAIQPGTPYYTGHWIPMPWNDTSRVFVGGGGGYVLNGEALKRLVRQSLPTCLVDERSSKEDVFVGQCLEAIGIRANHSADADGRQRFTLGDADFVTTFSPIGTGFIYQVYNLWGSVYGYKEKYELVSPQTTTFHGLDSPALMKRYHAILYKSCPLGTKLGDALNLAAWSRDHGGKGGPLGHQ